MLDNSVEIRPDTGAFRVVCILDNGITDVMEQITGLVIVPCSTNWSTDGDKEVVPLRSVSGYSHGF